jgi:hypothetical protein
MIFLTMCMTSWPRPVMWLWWVRTDQSAARSCRARRSHWNNILGFSSTFDYIFMCIRILYIKSQKSFCFVCGW